MEQPSHLQSAAGESLHHNPPCRSFWKRTRPTTRCNCGADSARRSRSATAAAIPSDSGWSPCWPTASSRAICLLGEADFLRLFPDAGGCRFFLVETPPDQTAAVQKTLEQNLGEYGFSAETTGRRLAELLAVQNTYLSTFQSLGGLGLLLGTFGLAAVQLRNVFERRGELALLRATGFRRATLGWLVLLEHARAVDGRIGRRHVGGVAGRAAASAPPRRRGPWASLAATLTAVLIAGVAAGRWPFGPFVDCAVAARATPGARIMDRKCRCRVVAAPMDCRTPTISNLVFSQSWIDGCHAHACVSM